MTKITLTDQYGNCTIESIYDDMNVAQIINELVIPCLLGRGYRRESILEVMEEIPYVEKSSAELNANLEAMAETVRTDSEE